MTEPQQQPIPQADAGMRCLSCGYDIVGVQVGGHCPECGSIVRQFAAGSSAGQGKAITSLVLGILSIPLACATYGFLGLPLGILGVYFARKARVAVQAGEAPVQSLGMATAGRVCGWVGIGISSAALLFFLIYVVFMVAVLGFGAAGAGGFGP